ncbi:hypothetical protein Slin15195_G087980 [Septoria linicola]|uniref:Uncharacterized protein n=1 Tax=Septoria linicola TaxID=215465 RepID=A0A9Q9AV90_9PEZI|nr:hypothetical protein Slin15195_G087980 [Septoria linicola]
MAFGATLWAGAQSAYSGAQAAYTKASNVVSGATFNINSYNEALGYDFENNDVDCNVDFDSQEEWTGVDKKVRRWDKPDEPYLVQDSTSDLRQLRLKVSVEAASRASEAAGVSMDYVKWALKLAAVEAARDIGFLANCKTATDAVNTIKARFPVLEDIQAAYHSGSLEGSTHRSTSQRPSDPRQLSRSYEPQAGITHPYDVRIPSNLDDIPIITDETVRHNLVATRAPPLYHPETRAELELVYEPVYTRGRTLQKHQHSNGAKPVAPVKQQKSRSKREHQISHRGFEDVELDGPHGIGDNDEMLGSMLLGDHDCDDDERLTFSGPIIGSGDDSQEILAKEGRTLRERMMRRG